MTATSAHNSTQQENINMLQLHPTPAHSSRSVILLAATLLALAGCAAPPSAGESVPMAEAAGTGAAVPPATGKVRINFIDIDSFDKSLEAALAGGATEIEIALVAPMSPNAISPRLGRWINTVQEGGGEVKVDSDARTRSASLLISLLDAAVGAWRDLRTKALVKDVDAEMVVRANLLESVKLTRRP